MEIRLETLAETLGDGLVGPADVEQVVTGNVFAYSNHVKLIIRHKDPTKDQVNLRLSKKEASNLHLALEVFLKR